MAKKQQSVKPHREPTKRQLSHWQQQQKRQRTVFITGVTIIAVSILLILVGWFVADYLPMHQTAVVVNGTEFNMQYYIDVLKLTLKGQRPEYAEYLAQATLQTIKQNELMRQGALSLQIYVTSDNISKEIKANKLPNTAAARDLTRSELLQAKLKAQYFDPKVPGSAEQRHILAMLLETESQAKEVRARLEKGEDFGKLAEELSVDANSKSRKGDYGWHPQSIYTDIFATKPPLEYAFSEAVGALSPPLQDESVTKLVGYWLVKVTEREKGAAEAMVQAMLLGSDEEARRVSAQLKAGVDFATLAKELSRLDTAKDNGGDLGTINKGGMAPAVDKFIFNEEIAPGTLSDPIRDDTAETRGGYWLMKVVEAQSAREISTEDRDYLKSKALNDWLQQLWANPMNLIDDSYLTPAKRAWAITRAQRG